MFGNTIYVRIEADQLTLLHAQSGRAWTDTPDVARRASNGKFLAVGREALALAGDSDVVVDNGYRHPRTLIADFILAELALKTMIPRVAPSSWFSPAPIMVMHPLASPVDGSAHPGGNPRILRIGDGDRGAARPGMGGRRVDPSAIAST